MERRNHERMTWDSLRRSADALDRLAGLALRPHGITLPQYDLLEILEAMRCGCCGEGECRCESSYLCQNDVGQRIATTKANVSGLVQRLTLEGYISREPNPADRRYNAVRITARGRQVLLAARPDVERVLTSAFETLDASESQELTRLLKRIPAHPVNGRAGKDKV